MNVFYIITSIVSLLLGGLTYLSTMSYIYGIVVFLVSLLYFFFILGHHYSIYQKEISLYRSCFNFINNFIINLSIKETPLGAFNSTYEIMDDDFKKEVDQLNTLNELEKLEYLKEYYRFHIYELFIDIVRIYEDRGGNILLLSDNLLKEAREQESFLNQNQSLNTRKSVEFITLWGFSLLILGVLRFALKDFYISMSNSLVFQLMIVGLFLFLLGSVEIFMRKSFTINLKGV